MGRYTSFGIPSDKEVKDQIGSHVNHLILTIFAASFWMGSALLCLTDIQPEVFRNAVACVRRVLHWRNFYVISPDLHDYEEKKQEEVVEMKEIQIQGIPAVIDHKGLDNINIYIKPPDGKVLITAPKRARERDVMDFYDRPNPIDSQESLEDGESCIVAANCRKRDL